MRHFVDLNVLANWVSMIRSETAGAIILPDDDQEGRFYERCAHHSARVVSSPSMAVPLLDAVSERGIRGVLALVRGETPRAFDKSILGPEIGDVASILICSSGYTGVMRDLCGHAWLTACEREMGDLRVRAVDLATAIHGRRNQAEADGELPLSLAEELTRIEWHALGGGAAPTGVSDIRELRKAIQRCDGMLVLEVLAAAISGCSPHGLTANRLVTTSELLSALRLAFPMDELEYDELFWNIQEWQKVHRYRVLTSWRSLDPLGIVLDQRYWEDDLRRFHSRLVPGQALGVAKLDLDNFKNVNEVLGHTGGDEALRVYSATVKDTVGVAGDVYRRGGDEMVIAASGVNPDEFFALCERARSAIEARFIEWCAVRELKQPVTASVGAICLSGSVGFDEAIAVLDEVQASAKTSGKNCVRTRIVQ